MLGVGGGEEERKKVGERGGDRETARAETERGRAGGREREKSCLDRSSDRQLTQNTFLGFQQGIGLGEWQEKTEKPQESRSSGV